MESRWGKIFRSCQDPSWGPPSPLYNGYWVLPGVKSDRSMTLTPDPLLVPWSWKSRVIPLHPVWAVRPVQSLSACTVELYLYTPYGLYGLYRTSVLVQGCTLLLKFAAVVMSPFCSPQKLFGWTRRKIMYKDRDLASTWCSGLSFALDIVYLIWGRWLNKRCWKITW
jgi:hypothetical protein